MRAILTISLEETVRRLLDRTAKEEGTNRSEIVREALRHYFARREFERLRGTIVPRAERRGVFTEEDL